MPCARAAILIRCERTNRRPSSSDDRISCVSIELVAISIAVCEVSAAISSGSESLAVTAMPMSSRSTSNAR